MLGDLLAERHSEQPQAWQGTRHSYNAAGERTATVWPQADQGEAEDRTSWTYDVAGRPTGEVDGEGQTTVWEYDLAGRRTTQTQAADRDLVSMFGYDAAGNATSETSPRGFTTTYGYDAANRLTGVAVPVDANEQMLTGYGYDVAGNHTRTTDGNASVSRFTWQPWNLREDVVEPATASHPAASQRTWTTVYDAGGLPVEERRPGGVTLARGFDELARLVSEQGSGPDAAVAARLFGYDEAGRRVRVGHPDGPVVVGYDDRGLLTSTAGPAGSASFGYDGAGRMVSRSDAGASSSYGWTVRDELASAADSLTGATRTWSFDDAGQPVTMGTGQGAQRSWAYDGFGRLTGDLLADAEGRTVAQDVWGYDDDGNPTSETVAFPDPEPLTAQQLLDPAAVAAYEQALVVSSNAAEGVHAFCYDRAGRLTRWDRPAPTDAPEGPGLPGEDADACAEPGSTHDELGDEIDLTVYGWDGAGNRTAAGSEGFVFDARNRLVSRSEDGSTVGTYEYSARGTLSQVDDGDRSAVYTFDGLDRQTGRDDVTVGYDALDRVTARTTGGVAAAFSYAGVEIDPVMVGDGLGAVGASVAGRFESRFARSPSGRLLGLAVGDAVGLVGLNRHGDLRVVHGSDGRLSDTRVWDPFGQPAAVSEMAPVVPGAPTPTARTGTTGPDVGFQGDWTDPGSGQVWMGARWYDPSMSAFTARDTVFGELATPVSTNRYTYAHANPLYFLDPDGRRVVAGGSSNDETAEEHAVSVEESHKPKGKRDYDRAVRRARKPGGSVERRNARDTGVVRERVRLDLRFEQAAIASVPELGQLRLAEAQARDGLVGGEASAYREMLDTLVAIWVRQGGPSAPADATPVIEGLQYELDRIAEQTAGNRPDRNNWGHQAGQQIGVSYDADGLPPVVAERYAATYDKAQEMLAIAGAICRACSAFNVALDAVRGDSEGVIRTPTNADDARRPADAVESGRRLPIQDPERADAISRVLDDIEGGGPLRYRQDGTVFRNDQARLPSRSDNYYREYTVPTPGSANRGTRRLVVGRGGEVYYTDDHYGSFTRIDPGR